MDYLICYDINTTTEAGDRRLRSVAKICEGYGIRVQKSVFECVLNEATRLRLLEDLNGAIDPTTDRVAVYPLNGDSRQRAHRLGRRPNDIRDPLIY